MRPPLSAVALLLTMPAVLAQQAAPEDDVSNWHWQMMRDGWHSGLGYGHWVFSLVFWVLVVLVVVLLIRSASSSRRSEPTPKTPLEILKERYARGEIDREEYEEKKRDLS